MSEEDGERRELGVPLGELDRLLGELGGRIALRHEQRKRRRAVLGWGAGVLIVAAGAAAIFLQGTAGPGTSLDTPALDDQPSIGTIEGRANATACALEDPVAGSERLGSPTPEALISTSIEAPQLLNRGELLQALDEEYPADLRAAAERGTSLIYFFVGDNGSIEDVRLAESSGYVAFDEAALRLARRFRFSPATDGGGRISAWVQVPITFAPARTGCPLCRRIPPPELVFGTC
jgi:TonB family protein